ncbi:hypothetical protein [Streptomyces kronopolitis]|uniref:hypothetical protein n=1 Tax=Streptomyces kronopolitis TaxID=1612435 RepID=UPI00343CD2F3
MMDATTALSRLTHRAETAFANDDKARATLADSLGKASALQLTWQMEEALTASAIAKPWRDLAKRIERHGVREGLAKQKAEALEVLLQYGMTASTSQIRNVAQLAEQEGLRRFLNTVDTIEIDEDAAAG